ncbi:MAG: tRNA pseudouridine(55) synthase TruB [candidate division KSB1 bacterium]|nr:tRNA pseudouridine(55) synthase TruB [candidate division KSB1 bacterium]
MKNSVAFTIDELHGEKILPVNKPPDWTSFDVVNKLRYASRVKKVGHAGTLDPFATGLLLVCFARATKRVPELMNLEKEYMATVKLGVEMDTDDVSGKPVATQEVPEISEEELREVLQKYTGEIEQIPPMYSAIKKQGQRLYKLARRGEIVEREPRRVHIYELELMRFDHDEIDIRVVCSRGTYIRALARDIGHDLGCGGHLKSLVRTRIGEYRLEDAWELPALVQEIKSKRLQR